MVKKTAVASKKSASPAKRAPKKAGAKAADRPKAKAPARGVKTPRKSDAPAKAAKPAKAPTLAKPAKPAKAPAPAKTAPSESIIDQAGPGKLPTVVAQLRKQVLTALDDLKAKDVKEVDVRGKASFTDMLIIASGTSTRHVKSIADEVVRFAKRSGVLPLGVEGEREAEWVLVDLGDIVVHVMLPRIREFYGLERLWTVGEEPTAANEAL